METVLLRDSRTAVELAINVGGPIYPAGYSAVPDGGITGADIKKMAEKKVFMSGFGKDTAQLNSTLKDLYMNYIQSPLEKGGNRFIDYMAGTEFEDKDSPFFGNQKDFKRIYERDVLPLASETVCGNDSSNIF